MTISHDAHRRAGRRRARLPELVGRAEAAELLGLSGPALSNRRHAEGWDRHDTIRQEGERVPFPEPVLELACGPIWLRDDVLEYGLAHGLVARDA